MCDCKTKCPSCKCVVQVAVYGTLRKHGGLHGVLAPYEDSMIMDTILGKLSHVRGGGFPVFTENGETEVVVEVYTIPVHLLKTLDSIEGVPWLYTREKRTTVGGQTVFIYVGANATPAEEIVSGDYFDA